jgi:hypothetical protein
MAVSDGQYSSPVIASEMRLALEKLDEWIEREDFQGWDPHDALKSRLMRGLAGRSHLMRILAVQSLRRCPINLRSLLGVSKARNPKAIGLFLASYAIKFDLHQDLNHLRLVRHFAQWLIENATPGFAGPCWGYNFDWANRGFFAPAGTPTIVNTAFIALSLLDAEPLLKLSAPEVEKGGEKAELREQNVDALHIARGCCEFILRNLSVYRPSSNQLCFSYTPADSRFVHNASLLGAWLLAAVYARTGESELAESAFSAARFTAAQQASDGSWPYGISTQDQWIDNFHTGFVLVAFKQIGRLLNTNEFETPTEVGYHFWKHRMFLPSSAPKYYPDHTYPVDVHCVAQAILTFLEFSQSDPQALREAHRISQWAIENLQDPDGFFHYQIHRWFRVRIPYMRWGQAWMQLALTKLMLACGTDHDNAFRPSPLEIEDAS